MTHAVTKESERLHILDGDGADRFIAATARLLDATLVTSDQRFIDAKEFDVLANR